MAQGTFDPRLVRLEGDPKSDVECYRDAVQADAVAPFLASLAEAFFNASPHPGIVAHVAATDDSLAYCGRDTLAMVRLFERLVELCK